MPLKETSYLTDEPTLAYPGRIATTIGNYFLKMAVLCGNYVV